MTTKLIRVNPDSIDEEVLKEAALLIKSGQVVGVPTETVYGLAANALDPAAVGRIYTAKNRPPDNPLIVHISSTDMLNDIVRDVPDSAYRLMELFWPGPLTMIFGRSALVPPIVSAGLLTVAVRLPAHPVMRRLIDMAGVPLAAPSANSSGRPSPTRAEHVMEDLGGRIPLVVDSGECAVGVESTVVSMTGVPRLLRPGAVTPDMLMEELDNIIIDEGVFTKLDSTKRVTSPGLKYKHYSPEAKLIGISSGLSDFIKYVSARRGEFVYYLCFDGEEERIGSHAIPYGRMDDAMSQAHGLFAALRQCDKRGAKLVYARMPAKDGVGLAVYNRLTRAAGFEVITLD